MDNPQDRIFSISAPSEGEVWFFMAREGSFGPFPSYGDAAYALLNYVKQCIEQGLHGGRRDVDGIEIEEMVLAAPSP